MHNLVVVVTLSVLDNIHPFGANLVWKIKTVNLSWNLEPKLIRICRIQQTCSLLTFRWETRFFGKLCSKKENCQFKLEFGVSTNWNMQNSMVVFTFWFLDKKHPFWAILVRKIKTAILSWKLVQKTNFNMENSNGVVQIFSFRRETPFLTNLLQKIKIVSLSWNLVPRLIWICRFQWRCSNFLF